MSLTSSNSCKTSFFNAEEKLFDIRDSIGGEFNLEGMVLPRSKHDCVIMIVKRRVYPTFIGEENRCKSAELHKKNFSEISFIFDEHNYRVGCSYDQVRYMRWVVWDSGS